MAANHEPGNPARTDAFGRSSLRLNAFVVLTVTFLAAAAYDLSDGILYLGDIDDRLRAVQIGQFLSGKGWYDLSLNGIAMPAAYISPWSRLIDLPYVLITWCLSRILGGERAVAAAFNIWPPILMLAFAWFSVGCMEKLMPQGRRVAPLHAFVAALAMIYAALEFVPGRIDHHNAQLVTLAAASYGVLCWSAAVGVLMAVALALSVTIGLETLPLIAVLWAGLALAWIMRRPGASRIFMSFSASIAVLAPLVTLVFAGPSVLLGIHNDIFSAPYVAAFSGFGLISALAAWLLPKPASSAVRFVALAVPGLLLLALIVAAMPEVLAGPYAIVDNLSRELWLEHVDQEHTVLLLLRAGVYLATLNLALQATIVLGAGILAWKSLKAGRTAPAIVLAMGLAAFLANLEAFRFIRFPAAILPLFLPQMLGTLSEASLARQKKFVVLFGGFLLVIGGVFQTIAIAVPVQRELGAVDAADFLMNDTCTAADRKAMKMLPAGLYMVTPAVGLTMLEEAAATVRVADISYHRASPGMRRMFEALFLTDPPARKSALAPFDYVAFCGYPDGARALFTPPAGSWFEALLNGTPIDALIPQPVTGSHHLKLYRIDHGRL